jgi:predicted regulator of Ras-like GTPase activity (Roadblock/LC7/MglB family)
MIQLNELSKQLDKVLDSQTKYCVLCNIYGSMIAYAGPDRVYAQNLSSLVSNIWAGYDRMKASAEKDDVESIILDCEGEKVVVVKLNKIIVSIVGSSELGIIRLKIKAIKRDLLSIL